MTSRTYHAGCYLATRQGYLATDVHWPDGRRTIYAGHPMQWRGRLAAAGQSSRILTELRRAADAGELYRLVITAPIPYRDRMNQALTNSPGEAFQPFPNLKRTHP